MMIPDSTDQITTAIVILNWNGKDFLKKYIPSVLSTIPPHTELIVADNASGDNSVAFLRENFPEVKIILLPENYGFARGYNEALKKVKATYYVLLNSDVRVSAHWVEPIVELMNKNPLVAACQPKILSLKYPEKFEYAGGAGGWIDKYGYPFCKGRVFDHCEKDDGQYDKSGPIFWASGACMFIRSEVFAESGGFDEYFFAHQEEIDLCWRIKNKGLEIYSQPASVVFHLGGGSLPVSSSKKLYLNSRNNLIMLFKNLSPKEKLPRLFVRMILDGIAGIRLLLTGKPGLCFAIIKAHLGFYGWLMKKGKAAEVQDNKEMQSLNGVYKGSIVRKYFLNKKKTFSDIVENNP